jgi:ABC-type sulfate transport system permease component
MISTYKKRILFDSAFILSVFVLPWWCSFVLAIIGIFFFQNYFESLIGAMAVDGLYNNTSVSFFISFFATLSVAFVYLISFWIKEHITLENRMK